MKRLVLNKETLRTLAGDTLTAVRGAAPTDGWTSNTACATVNTCASDCACPTTGTITTATNTTGKG